MLQLKHPILEIKSLLHDTSKKNSAKSQHSFSQSQQVVSDSKSTKTLTNLSQTVISQKGIQNVYGPPYAQSKAWIENTLWLQYLELYGLFIYVVWIFIHIYLLFFLDTSPFLWFLFALSSFQSSSPLLFLLIPWPSWQVYAVLTDHGHPPPAITPSFLIQLPCLSQPFPAKTTIIMWCLSSPELPLYYCQPMPLKESTTQLCHFEFYDHKPIPDSQTLTIWYRRGLD